MHVEPGELSFEADGTAASARYGDVYASRDGALGQARHVFLGGSACTERWRHREQFVILETGFGLGVNFLAAWQAWRDDPSRPRRLHFVSIEKHPLPAAAFSTAAPAQLHDLARQLQAQWPLPLGGLHRCEFEQGRVVLTLAFGDARELAPQLVLGADAIFLDGFAPERNPEMWGAGLLRALARHARGDCRVATWTTAHAVRDALTACGFAVERRVGFGRKRHMLAGRYAPRFTVRRHEPAAAYQGERSVIVVGAGLAGAAAADALARRGWRVIVLDSTPPACGASALPWGLMHPHFSADDNRLARLSRAGCVQTLQTLARVAPAGEHAGTALWQRRGVFQRAADPAEAQRWRSSVREQQLPVAYVQWLSAGEAGDVLGLPPAQAGLWWPGGVLASPVRCVTALLDQVGIRPARLAVGAIEPDGEGWVVRGTDGACAGRAAVVVVASGGDAPRLLGRSQLPVRAVAGQVTFVESAPLRRLRAGLGGDGTVLHAPDGTLAVGATYEVAEAGEVSLLDERSAARSNLARLERLLAAPVEVQVTGHFAGVRCVARDRLPYVGAVVDEAASRAATARLRGAHFEDLPRRRGLFASFALGSRGLTFAPLAAEIVAARIEGEPLPLERELAGALDPGRVLLRRLRRGVPLDPPAP